MHPRYMVGYFRAISNALRREMDQQVEQFGLTSGQGMFLRRIWFCQERLHVPVYARDLEEFFSIKHPTVSGILQRLEAGGYVEFHSDTEDRRCKTIHLTQKALDAQVMVEQHISQVNDRLLQGMSPEQVETFRQLMEIAAQNMGICFFDRPVPEQEESKP